jgi:pSer/pThr/pTyr-binding forkhead associated (FHA) protein
MERRRRKVPPNNDVYLIDREELLNISREHFQIERTNDVSYEIVDRGSTCGTIVDGTRIGNEAASMRCPLKSGARIIVGLPDSPYVFEFRCDA